VVGTDAWDSYLGVGFGGFSNAGLYTLRSIFLQVPVDILWTLPVYGWLLLASAWARRAPLLWALGPVFLIVIVELALSDQSWLLDAALAHTFAVDNLPLIPARVFSQLVPGALLGLIFIYGAIRLNRSDDS
jgi:hypothetical protein